MGSTVEALPKAAPMRLKVDPSDSDTRDRSEEERPALQKWPHFGHTCKENRVQPELSGPFQVFPGIFSLEEASKWISRSKRKNLVTARTRFELDKVIIASLFASHALLFASAHQGP